MTANTKQDTQKKILGVISFSDTDEIELFVKNVNLKYKELELRIDGKNEFVINSVNIFVKEDNPNWTKNLVYKCENEYTDKKYFRFLTECVGHNEYYFEKNGQIEFLNKLIDNNNIVDYFDSNWKKYYVLDKPLVDCINDYQLVRTRDDVNNEIITILSESDYNSLNIAYIYNLNTTYDTFNHITEVDQKYKLPLYSKKNCLDSNNKSSETIYNHNVANSNAKYLLLDIKCIDGCEVADIYDMEADYYYHNKKRGDLRTLSAQIIIGALILKNQLKKNEYLKKLCKHKIELNVSDTFSYVAGVIGKNKRISLKDKIMLGLAYKVLESNGIKLYIDYIDEVE